MTLRIKDIHQDEEDHLMEFVWGEQEADRNFYSPIVEVQSINDATEWLTDNEYDWKKMVLKFRRDQWDDLDWQEKEFLIQRDQGIR